MFSKLLKSGFLFFISMYAFFSINAQDNGEQRYDFEDSTLYILSHRYGCTPDIADWAIETIKEHQLNKAIIVTPHIYEDSAERVFFESFRHVFKPGKCDVSVLRSNRTFSKIYNMGYLSFVQLGQGRIFYSKKKKIYTSEPVIKAKNCRVSLEESILFWYRDSELEDGTLLNGNSCVVLSGVSNNVHTFNYKTKEKSVISLSPVLYQVSNEIYKKFGGPQADYLMTLRDTYLREDDRNNEKEFQLLYFSSSKGEINLTYRTGIFVSANDSSLDAYVYNKTVYISLDTHYNLKNWAMDKSDRTNFLQGFIKLRHSNKYISRTMPSVFRENGLAYPFVEFSMDGNKVKGEQSKIYLKDSQVKDNRVNFRYIDQINAFDFNGREYFYTSAIPFLFNTDGTSILLKDANILDIIAKGGELFVIIRTKVAGLGSVIMVQVLDKNFSVKREHIVDLQVDLNGICGGRLFYFDNDKLNFFLYPYQLKLDEKTAKHKVYKCSIDFEY